MISTIYIDNLVTFSSWCAAWFSTRPYRTCDCAMSSSRVLMVVPMLVTVRKAARLAV